MIVRSIDNSERRGYPARLDNGEIRQSCSTIRSHRRNLESRPLASDRNSQSRSYRETGGSQPSEHMRNIARMRAGAASRPCCFEHDLASAPPCAEPRVRLTPPCSMPGKVLRGHAFARQRAPIHPFEAPGCDRLPADHHALPASDQLGIRELFPGLHDAIVHQHADPGRPDARHELSGRRQRGAASVLHQDGRQAVHRRLIGASAALGLQMRL